MKQGAFYKGLGIDGAILSVSDLDKYKKYRAIVAPLFTQKVIDTMVPTMKANLEKVAASMARQGKQGKHTVIQEVYRAIGVCDYTCSLQILPQN